MEQQGQADIAICGVFAPTDHLFFHTGWGCMSADFVLKDGGTLIYCSPSPGVSTALGDFPGLALMDLMKPYMPPSRDNYEQVLRDIHSRTIQMWAGCIWVPIYEVMTRKHLTMVTLQENLEMAADIGIEATTSLDEAFAAAMERHGPDAKVIVLPFARYQLPAQRDPHARAGRHPARRGPGLGGRHGGTRRHGAPSRSAARRPSSSSSAATPDGAAARLMSRLYWPCAHCGGAFNEPLTMAAVRHRNPPRDVLTRSARSTTAARPTSRSRPRSARCRAERGGSRVALAGDAPRTHRPLRRRVLGSRADARGPVRRRPWRRPVRARSGEHRDDLGGVRGAADVRRGHARAAGRHGHGLGRVDRAPRGARPR